MTRKFSTLVIRGRSQCSRIAGTEISLRFLYTVSFGSAFGLSLLYKIYLLAEILRFTSSTVTSGAREIATQSPRRGLLRHLAMARADESGWLAAARRCATLALPPISLRKILYFYNSFHCCRWHLGKIRFGLP